jgi:hypothetical protein
LHAMQALSQLSYGPGQRYQLSVVSYQLSVISCQLSASLLRRPLPIHNPSASAVGSATRRANLSRLTAGS